MIEYKCAECGEVFEITEEQEAAAHKEKEKLWSQREIDSGVVAVCDECFEAFMKWFRQHPEIRIQ